ATVMGGTILGTSERITATTAGPITSGTARSTTLPRKMTCRNPLSMRASPKRRDSSTQRNASAGAEAWRKIFKQRLLIRTAWDSRRISAYSLPSKSRLSCPGIQKCAGRLFHQLPCCKPDPWPCFSPRFLDGLVFGEDACAKKMRPADEYQQAALSRRGKSFRPQSDTA